MNITTQVSKKTKTYKIFVLSAAMLFINACSETSADSEQTNLELNTLSGNVIDASKLTLVQKSELKSSTNTTNQSKAGDTTGSFTYPTTLSEFSGNISVAFDVANPEGIEQVYIGFDGSDLTLPICQQDCGTEYSAFVNGINPALFGLSGSEQNITLWVEDNDNDIYQVTSLGLTWRELTISGVTVTLDESSEELSVSWDALTGMLRYNVYISNDESLTGQNYIDLDGGEAKLALTSTSTVFTEKSIDEIYYILVTGIDGSGESAFSDKVMLGDDTTTIVTENTAPRFADQDGHIVTVDENSPEGTPVYTPSVSDPDEGAELTYSLSNGHGVFQMHSKTGVVYVNNQGLLDYETQPHSYELSMTVTDETSLSDSLTIIVQVNDVIENSKFVLDTTFSDAGIAEFNTYADTEEDGYLIDAKLDGSNKRVILSLDNGNYTIAKLNQDGTFDLSFGHNGIKHLNYDFDNDELDVFDDANDINSLILQKLKIDELNNKIYLLGYQNDNTSSINIPILIRLNSDGSIDNTFNTDGKYDVYADDLGDSTAVDAVIHSNGYIYLAASSMTSSALTKSFKLLKIKNASNSIITGKTYDITTSADDNEYIIGLIENVDGNLVALGYVDDGGGVNIIASEIDVDTLLVLDDSETNLGEAGSTNIINTYKVLDDNYVILGGSKAAKAVSDDIPESYSLVVKLNISTLALDDTFAGVNGYYIDDLIDDDSEETISIDINSDGDIIYAIKTENEAIYINQVDSDGTITAFGNAIKLKALTNDADYAQAVVLTEPTDTTNTINIFSSIEKDNDNGLSPSEVINTELEIYSERVANEDSSTELGLSANRTDYEFQMTDSLAVDSKLLHSSGNIITVTPRYNDSGTNGNFDAEGHTITRHDFVTGLINQTFSEEEQNSLLQRNGYSDYYIKRHSTQLIELAETDDNGDNYLLSAEIISNDGVSTLRVTKFTIDGEVTSGFPVEKTLPEYAYFESSDYNSTADRVALFGGYSDGQTENTENTENTSLLVTIDVECITIDDVDCPAFDMQEFSNTPGLLSSYNQLTSGVVQDDGSIIALGFGAVDDSLKEDTFLLKMNFDDSLIGIIDSDFDNSARDGTENDDGDDVLTVSTGNSNNVHSGKLIQLSDSSLVYFATQTESDAQSYLVRLVDKDTSSTQKYAIDVNFDDITGGNSKTDGMILLDMDSLSANSLNIEVKDLAVNPEDEIVLVGNVSTTEIDAGFIAKFNGLNGEADSLLGKNSLSGYSIPNGDAGCNYLNTGQNEGDLCDILGYDRVSIASDGSLIIHALLPDSSGSSNNSAILKFKEQQDDNATPYTIYSGSVD
ncbi:cadherin domain-containing protein [uncultured Psychrosphaera sp.]|uniref:cadherin domain-containing protein n=1 Tax=uncultured Psychrosphaera sp. TaxID=1403522 RepID=UPI00260C25CA|nr:cadherin domain-containing protein [uncultured Psychrosphaera sp.]